MQVTRIAKSATQKKYMAKAKGKGKEADPGTAMEEAANVGAENVGGL